MQSELDKELKDQTNSENLENGCYKISKLLLENPCKPIEIFIEKILPKDRRSFNSYVVEHIKAHPSTIYPLEVSIYEHIHYLENTKFDTRERFLLINKVLRQGIVYLIYSTLHKKFSRKTQVILDNAYSIIDEWCEDLTLTSRNRFKLVDNTPLKNNGNAIPRLNAIFGFCKNCFVPFDKTIPEDSLCRKNVSKKECKKPYIRDFIKPLSKLVEEAQSDLARILTELSLNDSILLDKLLHRINLAIKKIATSFIYRLTQNQDLIKNKKFVPYSDRKKMNIIPTAKLSKYDKEIIRFLKGKDTLDDLTDAFFSFIVKHPRLPLYEIFRLERDYFTTYLRNITP